MGKTAQVSVTVSKDEKGLDQLRGKIRLGKIVWFHPSDAHEQSGKTNGDRGEKQKRQLLSYGKGS